MNNNKIIAIEDVSLKTFQAEIKAMMIEGKQMTLSVFRQLPLLDILDENCNLRGVPWGLVNYFWKNNEASLHVVWQIGHKLYRSLNKDPQIRIDFDYGNYIENCNGEYRFGSNHHTNVSREVFKTNTNATDEEIEEIIKTHNTYKNIFETLSQLPQLFIAL